MIGSADGGLVIRLPSDVPVFARGTMLDVSGKLAAPYGQLEIRPAKTDIRGTGAAALPTPLAVPTGGLAESLEARLASTTGRLTAKPTKSASGDIAFVLERAEGPSVKVLADASSRVSLTNLKVGATYRVTGVVGQRATRSGALDGYRICLRDPADIVVTTAPTPSGSPAPAPSASAGSVAVISI